MCHGLLFFLQFQLHYPSKHGRSDLHPIQIGSEAGLMILAHQLASRPDPFGQNLTQSARTNLDPCWFCTIWSVEESNRVWKCKTGSGPVAFCRNQAWWFLHPDQIHLAKTWAGHPDQILAGFAQYYLGLLWKNRTELDAGSQIWCIQYMVCVYVCVCVCVCCFSDAGGRIPLTILADVCQCCCLLMFVFLPLFRHFPCCKTWWIMNLNLNTTWPNSGCTLAMIAITGHHSQHNQNHFWIGSSMFTGIMKHTVITFWMTNNKSRGLDE